MRKVIPFALTATGLVLTLVVTLMAFSLPLGPSLELMVQGAFGDKFGIARTLVKSVPLLLTGLGVVVAWRGGMFNIGGEGQFLLGGLAAAWVAFPAARAGEGSPVLLAGLLVASAVGGALWAGLAAWLYVRRGVEVVISTILLNFVAMQLLGYAVSGPLKEKKAQVPLSDRLPDSLMLARFDRQTDLHVGIFLAAIAALLVWVFLFRTRPGFELRIVGENARLGRANQIPADRTRVGAMLLSGALCGFAGGIEYVGVAGQLGTGFSQNWGFLGIPVALLGALHPLALLGSALYFGALFAGSENLARFTPAGTTIIYVIQAAAMLGFVAIRRGLRRSPRAVEV